MQFISPRASQDIRADLSIPLDAHVVTLTVENPLGWEGYNFDLVGTYEGRNPHADHAPLFWLYGSNPEEGVVRVALIAWQRRVSCQDVPAYIDARWHPAVGETVTLCGLEKTPRLPDAKRVLQGLKLLREIERRGRRANSMTMTQSEFREAYPRVYKALWEREGERPSQLKVAAELGMVERTFRRHLERYNLPWPPA